MSKQRCNATSECFVRTLPPTSYRIAAVPLVDIGRGASRLDMLRTAGVTIHESAEQVFRRIEQRGFDARPVYTVLVRSADVPPRERNCEAMRKKCKEHGLSCAPLSLIADVALYVKHTEMLTLGVKWLVFMHHRVKISDKERGYFVLAVSEHGYTLTVCHGTSKWADGVAFVLARFIEEVKTLEIHGTHEHAEPVY